VISPNQFKSGMIIKLDGKLYSIIGYQHVKPGKGPAYYRTKLKSLKDNTISERTFRAVDKIEKVLLDERKLIYLYNHGDMYYFMDQQTFEQLPVNKNKIINLIDYLKEDTEVIGIFSNGKIIDIKMPTFIELLVEYTEPGIRGDTAKSTTTKLAHLETGAKIQVPIFINKGDKIRIDTRSKQYAGKANSSSNK